jgi:hypothetical protein
MFLDVVTPEILHRIRHGKTLAMPVTQRFPFDSHHTTLLVIILIAASGTA